MSKEFLKLILLPLLLLIMLSGFLLTSSAFAALERQPYLQSVSDTRVVVRWRTTSATTSRVRYGSSVGNLNNSIDDASSTTEHEVVISGLNSNRKYFYSVGTTSGDIEAGNDADHYFFTAPDIGSSQKVRIWAIGDPGTGTADQKNVRDAYYNLDSVKTDVVLTLGDNAYSSGTDSEYTSNFFNIYNDLFRHAPVWATRGNHEKNPGVYETAFTHPKNAESGGVSSGTELYYSFDYGNIHFVCLDSFTLSNLNGTAMHTWLEADLASTTQKWIVAFWHHPPYSRSSSHDSDSEPGQKITREKANPVLERYGVDIQLGGHNHFYSRTVLINGHYGLSNTYNPATHAVDTGNGRADGDGVYDKVSNIEGAVYVLAGSSGKKGYTPINHPANFIESVEFGSLVIDVEGDQMDVRMLRENGTIEDYFSITKSSSTNRTPSVYAGIDHNIEVGIAVTLDATVSDDGLPGNALSVIWSKISGPGEASFSDPGTIDTTVTFPVTGSYVLRLEASDSVLTGSDEVIITVTDKGVSGSKTGFLDLSLLTALTLLLFFRLLSQYRLINVFRPLIRQKN